MQNTLFLFLVGILLTVGSAQAATIDFLENPRFRVDDYLVFLLRRIPLWNLEVEQNSNVIHVRGELVLNFAEFEDKEKRDLIAAKVRSALAGEFTVTGATFESAEAQINFIMDRPSSNPEFDDSLFRALSATGAGTASKIIVFEEEYFHPDPGLLKKFFDDLEALPKKSGTHLPLDSGICLSELTIITTLNDVDEKLRDE